MNKKDYHCTVSHCSITHEECDMDGCQGCHVVQQVPMLEWNRLYSQVMLEYEEITFLGRDIDVLISADRVLSQATNIDVFLPEEYKQKYERVEVPHLLFLPITFPRLYEYIKIFGLGWPDYYLVTTEKTHAPIFAVYPDKVIGCAPVIISSDMIPEEDAWLSEVSNPYSHTWTKREVTA